MLRVFKLKSHTKNHNNGKVFDYKEHKQIKLNKLNVRPQIVHQLGL